MRDNLSFRNHGGAVLFGVNLLWLSVAGCGSGSSTGNRNVPLGEWGTATTPVNLQITRSSGDFASPCVAAHFDQMLQPDVNGRFDVIGSYHRLNLAVDHRSAHFSGSIQNNRMTLTITVTNSDNSTFTEGPYTLTYRQQSPADNSSCP